MRHFARMAEAAPLVHVIGVVSVAKLRFVATV